MLGIEPKALHMVGHLSVMLPASLPSLVLYCASSCWFLLILGLHMAARAVSCVLGSPLSLSGSLHSAARASSSFLPFCCCVESPCVDEPEFINVLTRGFGSGPLML